MAGRLCPSCRKNVDAPPDPEPKAEQVVEDAHHFAAEQMRAGLAPCEVQTILIERGMDIEAAVHVVGDVEHVQTEAAREAGRRNMIIGAIWCVGGIAVTTLTYQAAANGGGGTYMIAWGVILFGGIQFLRGVAQSSKP